MNASARPGGAPAFAPPPGDDGCEARRLEGLARSLLDGLAVWGRELSRPEDERSPIILSHERTRSRRLTELWQRQIDHPWLRGPLNMAQITFVCALQLETRNPQYHWRPGRPALSRWLDRIAGQPSLAATAPAPRQ